MKAKKQYHQERERSDSSYRSDFLEGFRLRREKARGGSLVDTSFDSRFSVDIEAEARRAQVNSPDGDQVAYTSQLKQNIQACQQNLESSLFLYKEAETELRRF